MKDYGGLFLEVNRSQSLNRYGHQKGNDGLCCAEGDVFSGFWLCCDSV